MVGVPVVFARTPADVEQAVSKAPRFALLDLTSDVDHEGVLAQLARAQVPVLGFTTHVLAKQTQPWHARCRRVVTKETLTRELGRLLEEGLA